MSKSGTVQFFCMSLVILIVFTSIIIYKRNLDDYLDKLDELNLRCKCETRTIQRVVNGKLEDKLFFPWQVSISKLGGHVCMGTIISSYYVLTSQHCLKNGSKHVYEVRVALYELFDPKINEKTYRIDEIYDYPQFKLDNVLEGGDLSIVKLRTPIKFEHGLVEPACLELENPQFENLNADELVEKSKKDLLITSGFGTSLPVVVQNNQLINKITPSLVLKTGYFHEVVDLFLNDPNSKELLKKFICINSLDKNNDNNCHGHSGASLNGKNSNGLVVVKGVSSLSIPIKINDTTVQFCKSYSLYSRLTNYREFIVNTVGNLRCKISLIEQNLNKSKHR